MTSSENKPHTYAIPLPVYNRLSNKPKKFGTMSWNGVKFILVRREAINAFRNVQTSNYLKKIGHPISDEKGIVFRKRLRRPRKR
jgi:hypothetical protein